MLGFHAATQHKIESAVTHKQRTPTEYAIEKGVADDYDTLEQLAMQLGDPYKALDMLVAEREKIKLEADNAIQGERVEDLEDAKASETSAEFNAVTIWED